MFKRACSLGLSAAYRDDANLKLIVRMTIALALLPPDLAIDGFHVIKSIFLFIFLSFDITYLNSYYLE